ncbi:MAG: helix-turn-helix domain-containing protein [Candidatus Tectimicrobiota bacterium]
MDRIDLQNFGARLERARKRRGLTQIELAELIGQKQANYWKLESGNASPRGDTIYTLCRVLGVSADYLLGLAGEAAEAAASAGGPPGRQAAPVAPAGATG